MTPTVSIIMPCYNAAAYLPQSMGSVLSQTFANWELIAVDDGSSDGTLAWLQAQTDPRLRVHSQANQGVSAARNAGLRLARGKYVAFLDVDDTWEPTFLEKLLSVLDMHPEAVLAYSGWKNVGLPGDRGEPYVPPDYEQGEKWVRFLAACPWPIHAALTRSDAVRAAGGFDRRYKNAEDYALWLNIATLSPVVRIPEVLAFYHHHSATQASRDRERAALDNLDVQLRFLEAHPEIESTLGKAKVRDLVYGGLLKKAYDCYWQRELKCARHLFLLALGAGYGIPRNWKYTLLSMLPISWHDRLARLSKMKKNTHKQV
ncbi:MAG: glycosyl transferase [Nitrosomonadales bacterium]|nr:MAG: glycosyl transferase [Nitrosomonadales bacterium]